MSSCFRKDGDDIPTSSEQSRRGGRRQGVQYAGREGMQRPQDDGQRQWGVELEEGHEDTAVRGVGGLARVTALVIPWP